QTRTAKKTMNTSHTSTSRCGIVIQRFSLLSSPVTYWARWPGDFLRKRRISQKNTASERMNQKPTSQKISEKTKSMSPEKVAEEGTRRSITTISSESEDEEEDDDDEAAGEADGDQERPPGQILGCVLLGHLRLTAPAPGRPA